MTDWRPELHPRDHDGKFSRGAELAAKTHRLAADVTVAERGDVLGPQGEYNGPPLWRAFPSSLDYDDRTGKPGRDGADPFDARAQVEGSEDAFGGIGRWFGPEHMGAFYGDRGTVLVAVRFRDQDMPHLREPANASGIHASKPLRAAVVAMRVNIGGTWHEVKVPPNLITKTSTDWDAEP